METTSPAPSASRNLPAQPSPKMSDDDSAPQYDWAGPLALRIAAAASFVPAFPLCLTHGILSHRAVPAVGLVPLAVSSSLGVFLAVESAHRDKLNHPALIFVSDVVLAAALMIVLVFTWIGAELNSPGLSMLAAYATLPLFFNFLIHLFLSLRAIYIGLAVDQVAQWVAFQAIPPDCPNCSHSLRPAFPSLPWFRRPFSEYTRLFVSDEETRYRDDEEDARVVEEPPEAVEVIRKDRKGKSVSSPPVDESAPWGS